jgi:hypothetical protein
MAMATALAALGGCSGSNGAVSSGVDSGTKPPAGGGSALPCDVDTVLTNNCQICHGATPSFGAPMSLVTYSDLTAPSKSNPAKMVYQVISNRIHNDASPMPPPPKARLSAADSSVLDSWIAAGAPGAAATTCGGGTADGGPVVGTDGGGVDPQALPCTPDTFIKPGSPYSAPPSAEEYVCYGFDVTTPQKRHVIAFAPQIDNKAVVHHLLLYRMPQAVSPTPTVCGGAQGELVTGWAPGVGNLIVPPEAGFPEEGTTHYMMQIHYNNVGGSTAQSDASGFALCTTDQLRPNDAAILAFGSTNFTIPAQGTLAQTCDYTFTEAPVIHAFTAQAHMHLRGHAMTTLNTTANYTLVDVPNFNFQQQYVNPVTFEIKSGDVIRNTCTWDNTTGSPISFGPTTEDEMCFDFVNYWPRITTPTFDWMTPSASSKCPPP